MMLKSGILFLLLVQLHLASCICSKACSECFKCAENSKGEEKCVRKPNCCPGNVQPTPCFINPCDKQSTECPDGALCITDYCGGCKAHYYDKYWNKLENDYDCNYSKYRHCRQMPDEGVCRRNLTRWYFDQYATQCQEFKYRGCFGNSNNYESKEDCEKACKGVVDACPMVDVAPPPEGCHYESLSGSNGCAFPVVMCPDAGCGLKKCGKCQICDNTYSDQCKSTWNSACKPVGYTCTRDRFCEDEACRKYECISGFKCEVKSDVGAQCVPDLPKLEVIRRCRMNAESGRCRAALPMFYYDKVSGRCTKFTYGGCAGNMNRFKSKEECNDICGKVGGRCAVLRLGPPPEGCDYKAMISPSGCDHYVIMCPGLGCATNPCKECQFCSNKFAEDCRGRQGQCKPIGYQCEDDPVCELWKTRECKRQNCPAGTECRYNMNNRAICVKV